MTRWPWMTAFLLSTWMAVAPAMAAQDLVIVLDNSGSMRANDPERLAAQAVEEVVMASPPGTRVAILIFDAQVQLAVPLTLVDGTTFGTIQGALTRLNYRGQWTDIPAAIERAIYHLRQEGRPGASHDILFMTDGMVDTGNADRDRDRERWLLEELTKSADEAGIRIFGLAFSDDADYRVIQALSHRTQGEYLRALSPDELVTSFETLFNAMQAPRKEPEPEPVAVAPVQAAPQIVTVPVPVSAQDERGSIALVLAIVAMLIALGGGIGLYLWMRRRGPAPPEEMPGAMLVDLAGITGLPEHPIRTAITVIGRHPAAGPGIATSVVIDRTTVSRRHATITWRDGRYWIEDNGSSNCTFVNGSEIKEPTPLVDGDRVRFDTYEFEFRLPGMDETRVRSADFPGDQTIVRAQASSTTVFKVKPEPELDDADIDFDISEPYPDDPPDSTPR